MPGTNVWSVVFVLFALVVAALISGPLINMWRRFFVDYSKAIEKDVRTPSGVGPTVVTILIVGIFILAVTLGWNAMVNVTTSRSDYKAPAEIQEQKKVQESQLPSSEDLDKTRAEQKERAQSKPHKEALDSYDESMKREAEKIKQRNK